MAVELPGLSLGFGSGPSAAGADTGEQITSGTVEFGGARTETLTLPTALIVSGVILAGLLIYARSSKN